MDLETHTSDQVIAANCKSNSSACCQGIPKQFEIEKIQNLTIENDTISLLNPLFDEDSFPDQNNFIQMAFVFILILTIILGWYPLKYWWEKRNIRLAADPDSPFSHLPLPPGEFGPPIIGETFSWLTQGSKFNSSRRKKYGNVFKTNTVGQPMVRVSGHKYVREILRGEHDLVTTIWPINVRKILGENVLVNSLGAVHRLKRRVVSKAFTINTLRVYSPVFQYHIKRNIKEMSETERPLVYNRMLRLTYDVAAATLLGLDPEKPGCQRLVTVLYNLVSNIFCIPLMIPGLGFSTAMKARAEILELLQDHISEKKKAIMQSIKEDSGNGINEQKTAFDVIIYEMFTNSLKSKKQNGFVHENGDVNGKEVEEEVVEPISDFALKEMALELMFAGYYTSGSALTSYVLELARHKDVFRKLEDELLHHGILKDENTKDEEEVELTREIIHRLTYVEQVLKETLRVRPPVLGGYRKARKTFQLGDYRVPKGWTVIYNIRDTHEFEYEGMDEFDPERFSPEREKDDKFKFIPFGGGPRTCVGLEFAKLVIKISVIELFRRFRTWELVSKKLPKMRAIPTLHPTDGLPCIFHQRKLYGVVER